MAVKIAPEILANRCHHAWNELEEAIQHTPIVRAVNLRNLPYEACRDAEGRWLVVFPLSDLAAHLGTTVGRLRRDIERGRYIAFREQGTWFALARMHRRDEVSHHLRVALRRRRLGLTHSLHGLGYIPVAVSSPSGRSSG